MELGVKLVDQEISCYTEEFELHPVGDGEALEVSDVIWFLSQKDNPGGEVAGELGEDEGERLVNGLL